MLSNRTLYLAIEALEYYAKTFTASRTEEALAELRQALAEQRDHNPDATKLIAELERELAEANFHKEHGWEMYKKACGRYDALKARLAAAPRAWIKEGNLVTMSLEVTKHWGGVWVEHYALPVEEAEKEQK